MLSGGRLMFRIRTALLTICLFSTHLVFCLQSTPDAGNLAIEGVPPTSEAHVGDKLKFRVVSHGLQGTVEEKANIWFAGPFDAAFADRSGNVSFFQPGRVTLGAVVNRKTVYTTINVLPREVASVEIDALVRPLVAGGMVKLKATPRTEDKKPRRDLPVEWSSQ